LLHQLVACTHRPRRTLARNTSSELGPLISMSNTSTKNAEKYLISSVLRNGDLATATKHGINASMFHSYGEEWAWVEQFMLKHKKSPGKTAFRTKFSEFPLRQIDDTGHWAEEVKRCHSRFLLLGSMEQVSNLIAEGQVDQAVSFAYTNIIQIAGAVGVANDSDIFSDFEDILVDAKVRLKRVNQTGFSGIPTGFITLDERTGGPQPGDFWTVAARLGEGKSFTMQRMATTACMHSKVVQYDLPDRPVDLPHHGPDARPQLHGQGIQAVPAPHEEGGQGSPSRQ
jgi:hypothetical protein